MRIEQGKIDLPPEMLEDLLESTSACALGLLMVGADQFIVYAGDLSQEGFDQVRHALQKYWPASTQQDLNRYVGLYLDEKFFYLFAKFLPHSDTLLSLVFTPQTPWVRIRQDMTDVMRRVLVTIRSQLREGEGMERSLQFTHKHHSASDPEVTPSEPDRVGLEDRNQWIKEETVPKQIFPKPPDRPPGWQSKLDESTLNAPSSGRGQRDMDSLGKWVPLENLFFTDKSLSSNAKDSIGELPARESFQIRPVEESFRGIPQDWQSLEEASQPESDLVRLFHEDFAQAKPPLSSGQPHKPVGQSLAKKLEGSSDLSEEATQPHTVEEAPEFDQIQISDITFYLVPRQDRHYLLGELAHRLRDWFPTLCETYGWQLDLLSVRPDYIKWRLHDFPDALIHEMLEVVRKRTSERIFRIFPNLREGNPTSDFWSPGYLVDRENQDFSTQVLIAHMAPKRQK